VFAGGGGNTGPRIANVNEDAAAIATPSTADPTGPALANTAYFRFDNYGGETPEGAVPITYCLGGSATGATQAALDADADTDPEHDYIFPSGYDPAATTPGYSPTGNTPGPHSPPAPAAAR